MVKSPHPAVATFSHLRSRKREKADVVAFSRASSAWEKVPDRADEGSGSTIPVDEILQTLLLAGNGLRVDVLLVHPSCNLCKAFLAGQHGLVLGQ